VFAYAVASYRRAGTIPAPPRRFHRALPSHRRGAPSCGWVHEIKHDGYRLQIHIRDGRVRLFTRNGVDWTSRYPWIVEDAARLSVRSAIMDAECCIAGDAGVTDFTALHSRIRDHEAFAYVFDLLTIDGEDLRRQALAARRAHLQKITRKAKPGIRLSEHIEADGETVFAHACKLGLEGIVSKRLDAPYRSGRGRTWLKTKNKAAPAYLRVLEEE
jgi:bifunctional non-homologous end joining protein LigD